MGKKAEEDSHGKESAHSLIKKIQSGQLNPNLIRKKDRMRCIWVLMLQGYSEDSLAQIFAVHEKTIRRNVEDILEEKIITQDQSFIDRTIARYVMYQYAHIDHLIRLSTNSEASVNERATSRYYASLIHNNMITKLQSLGPIPSKPQVVIGDFNHKQIPGVKPAINILPVAAKSKDLDKSDRPD